VVNWGCGWSVGGMAGHSGQVWAWAVQLGVWLLR
jgi:hypothetical protein